MIRRRIRRVRISQRTRISKRNYSVEISTSSCVTDSSDVSVSSSVYRSPNRLPVFPPLRAVSTTRSSYHSFYRVLHAYCYAYPHFLSRIVRWLFCRLLLTQSVILLFLSSAAPPPALLCPSTSASLSASFTSLRVASFYVPTPSVFLQ